MSNTDLKPYRIMLAGAGDRGQGYMKWIRQNPGSMELTALADPIPSRREILSDKHKLPESQCFEDWKDMLTAGIEADAVIISTQDNQHLEPAQAFLEKGYHVLLEKPMAVDIDSIKKIQKAAEKSEGTLTVCHVLRYDPLFRKIKDICDSGSLGKIQSMYHAENVSWYHYVHSYVRGNWRNSKESSPLILAKSCHDLDLIQWMMPGNAASILSTAQRSVFVENLDRPERCSPSCPEYSSCKFEAEKTYLYGRSMKLALSRLPGLFGLAGKVMYHYPDLSRNLPILKKYHFWKDWPTSTISDDLSPGGVRKALETGPYGRCVYRCDNDQPEHWESIIEFDSGASAVFRLHGMSREEGRTLRIDGTEGTLDAKFGNTHELSLTFHDGSPSEAYSFDSGALGHSGADSALMDDWFNVLKGSDPQSPASVSALSHYMAFAACEAWETGKKVSFE
ncbi:MULTISPECIES: Gfo/Idh/MocA family protein [unclassified Oceanispirochaeta]|uniref:Gfo/Idh/MocA family protein n=1 Tax=unclassified Oceanispirochaeta TaxID=2635722 RepID=UPI000E098BEE|nr:MULTISPECIES: Gfo/Idh/MocA family oxidoreductase [unclassified Oceanispirochaeta]MBF9015027.1 Gfo/Idh/MocA family oxidoreductase [Oceanispirochaeta sp. M2]NPD71485.1 Gfo/Idh/MocA family oxidoreductase [Oceanispirochaeta sp. M1]RDG33060.1 gfo/Idh/MocA family oxidoreductase [Oceanispirochaeta sp. M1]